jgi:hypothetical protein
MSGMLHSTPLKKFRPRNLEIDYHSSRQKLTIYGLSQTFSIHTYPKVSSYHVLILFLNPHVTELSLLGLNITQT